MFSARRLLPSGVLSPENGPVPGRPRAWLSAAVRVILLAGVAGTSAAGRAAAGEGNSVVYAPDVGGVGRIFLVGLRVPNDAPDVKVTVPEGVLLFDQTRPPFTGDVRRFYFRAVKPSEKAEIRFALPRGEVTVSIDIWSFEDLRRFRTLKGVQLPRRWPLGQPLPELKERQVYPTEAENKRGRGSGGWLDVPDDVIWDMQPDATIPRWHWTNIRFGCPVHGTEIYRERAYYPWLMNGTPPWDWKIQCPIGGERYPSNDFAKGDMTGGPFPDDGIGGGCLHNGQHYGFIAELCQFYCRRMMAVAPECAHAYANTGDVRYAHKALVAMCRLAEEYAYLATMTQHRHRNTVAQVERFGPGPFHEGPCLSRSGFTTYDIDQPLEQSEHAVAYDRIFPAIEQDSEIIPFLKKKGYPVTSHEEVRRFIEENLFAVWMQGSMDGACASNEPSPQRGFAKIAEVLNYRRGADFMDFLYDGSQSGFTPMRIFVPNTYFRDGAPFESTGGYNGAHVAGLGPIADSIEHLRQMRPEVYPESRYPPLSQSRRYQNIFDFAMDTVTIDRSYPGVGDDSVYDGFPQYKRLPKRTWQNGDAAAFEQAYRTFRDPKFAWALARNPSWQPSADFPFTRAAVAKDAARWPDGWNDRSSLHDGYGLAILRGGQGDGKRALWMMYGRSRSHTQDDVMDVGLQGYQGILLSHLGYPRNWGYWEHSWTSHNVARQFPDHEMTAQPHLFANAGPVHLAEARAQSLVDRVDEGKGYELPPEDWQRRMIVLVDVDSATPGLSGAGAFYAVDFYRVSGGTEHWRAFHGQEGDFAAKGITLTKQEGGTLAGPNVPYGDPKWLKDNGCSYGDYGWSGVKFAFPHLYHVEKGESEGVWSADWRLKTGHGLHVRLTVASAEGMEVNVCDGKPPAGGSPYEMKWLMLHKQGNPPLKTQLLNIIEPYLDRPLIQEVRPLRLSGDDESGFAAAGCVVRLADRTDTLLASADPAPERVVLAAGSAASSGQAGAAKGDLSFAGRFAFCSERDGVPVSMVLVGGTKLAKGPFGIRLESPEYRGMITQVDRTTETVLLSPAPPMPEALVGNYVFLTNPSRRIAYKVVEAKQVGSRAQLRLAGDSRIGAGRVTGVEDYRVQTETPFTLDRLRYYHGARLVNAAGTAEYRLVDVRTEKAALIDPKIHRDAKAGKLAKEFLKGAWFDVYDYGVGDEIVFPHQARLTRTGANLFLVAATHRVSATVPAGYYWKLVAWP